MVPAAEWKGPTETHTHPPPSLGRGAERQVAPLGDAQVTLVREL